MYYVLLFALIIILAVLQGRFWLGAGSLQDVNQLKQQITTQQQHNQHLKERNQTIYEEVQDFKKGQQAVEERARSELGMIREGETFFQIIDEEP